MVGDFLIESECDAGHQGSATFRGHAREVVYAVARTFSDRCEWPHGDDNCGHRVSHVVTDLGFPPESSRRAPNTPPVRKTTKPSMQAVMVPSSRHSSIPVLIVDDSQGEESTEPPPPSTQDE